MAGIIPRNCKKLKVTFLVDTSGSKVGDVRIVEKTEYNGWSDGHYAYFVSMLRNPEICKVEPIYD